MNYSDTWLPRGTFKPRRYRPGGIGNWSGHLPFANDLVQATQPHLLVELGTHYGESYFGFCQAVADNGVSCKCYAVDTWVGEQHATFYDESVFEEVTEYNKANYRSFSFLLRATFDEARNNFSDNSIDILHIDGLHTYPAVRHDFENWLPAVKPGGLVLLHDICARHADFGVWKLWEELQGTAECFSFLHSWGLGVFRKPGGESAQPFLSALFSGTSEIHDHLRQFYSLSAKSLEYDQVRALEEQSSGPPEVLRIYPEGAAGYSAELQYKTFFRTKEWQHLSVDILSGSIQGGIRIDLSEHSGVIDLSGILVRRAANRQTVFQATGADELETLIVAGDMVALPTCRTAEYRRYLSKGTDPQLFLKLDPVLTDQPLILDVWVRVDSEVTPLLSNFTEFEAESRAVAEPALAQAELLAMRSELIGVTGSNVALQAELVNARSETKTLQAELVAVQADLSDLGNDVASLTAERDQLRTANQQLLQSVEVLEHSRAKAESQLGAVLASRSWRFTSPIRRLLGR